MSTRKPKLQLSQVEQMERHRKIQRDSMAIRFFETMIASGRMDFRAPMQAARCAKACADVIMQVLDDAESGEVFAS